MSRIQSVEGTPRIRIVEPWWSRNIVFEQPGVHCFIRHSSSKIDARPLKDKFCECSHVVLEEIEHPPDLLEKALFCLLQPTRSCFLRLSSSVNSYSTLLCMVLCTPLVSEVGLQEVLHYPYLTRKHHTGVPQLFMKNVPLLGV